MTKAQINLKNLRYNFLNIRKKIGDRKVMAVVKADAYGHGMLECAQSLDSLGDKSPEYFAVAFLAEARILQKKIKKPILVFEPFNKNNFKLIQKNIIPTVFMAEHLELLKNLKRKIKVHIKIDTGMGDTGVSYAQAYEFIKLVKKEKNIVLDGIYSHFAASDEVSKKFARLQLNRFKAVLDKLEKDKIDYGLAHMANSGAILDIEEAYFDMARPGISLYGCYPSLETTESIKLKPVMSLISRVSNIQRLKKGQSVSYGRKFIAKKNTRVAVAPIGYADGFSRGLSGKATAIIKGKIYNQIGRAQMDKIVFNINKDNVKIGDRVTLIGQEGNKKITAWDIAQKINTISYEVTCGISKRVKKVFVI